MMLLMRPSVFSHLFTYVKCVVILWFNECSRDGIRQQCGLSGCSWESGGLWCVLTSDRCGQTSSHTQDTGMALPQSATAGDGTTHLSGKTWDTNIHTEFIYAGKAMALQTTSDMIYLTLMNVRYLQKNICLPSANSQHNKYCQCCAIAMTAAYKYSNRPSKESSAYIFSE